MQSRPFDAPTVIRAGPQLNLDRTNPVQSFRNMKPVLPVLRLFLLTLLALAGFASSARAQEVTIPDPGLNAAIRDEVGNPSGPLTVQDLLSLTNLNARSRNVGNIEGLEAARNLVSLDLQINHLSD